MQTELADIQWLRNHHPGLWAGFGCAAVSGILRISAYYDATANRLVSETRSNARGRSTYLADDFAVSIKLADTDEHGWPKVYDATGRYRTIARRYGIPAADLHFYPGGRACLGLPYPDDCAFTVRSFVESLVEPFFYRLAYVDLYGLAAARSDLWPEYSHGKAGVLEHRRLLRGYSEMPTPAHQ